MAQSRLPKNENRICELCSQKFYRRGNKVTRFCSKTCKYASQVKTKPQTSTDPKALVDAATAGNIIGYSTGWVRRLGKKGRISRTPDGRCFKFNVDELREYALAAGY